MGGAVDFVTDLWDDSVDWVTEDILGIPSDSEIAAQQAAAQAEMEANMAAQIAAQQAYMEEEARRSRISSIRDTRAGRKAQLRKQRKKLATKKAGEKRTQSGIRIGGIAAQRGGTGKLVRGKERRIGSTKEGYNKWGSKGKGLSLALRGGGPGGRRPS